MQLPEPVVQTDLEGLDLFNRGKVRDIYALDSQLLIVTTDRISCFDVVLQTAIPLKGKVLTHLTEFWLTYLNDLVRSHLITTDVERMGEAVEPYQDLLRGRTMLVKRAEVLPVECVVRGYLSGSGWRAYQREGAVCGVELPPGLQESDKLPEPIFTPTTKAESGHDEPITFEQMCAQVGRELAERVRDLSVAVYRKAADYAADKGIIISDTKFEWGFCDGELTLVDEVLTPDSSRFWPAETYEPGGPQDSYDKQYVRDWLDEQGWDHEPPSPGLPAEVVHRTVDKYLEACRSLTGAAPEF
ncbi:MAG: phosphoribosylaminoimidazolesuccinocarboxamide synthase [Candidatus Brocadiia bacterium]